MKGKRALPKLRPLLGVCEASLAEASGCHAQLSWRPRQAVLWGSRGYSRRYTIPNPAYLINMDIHRATRSDPKNDVRRGKAPPRRFTSIRRRSQDACAPVQGVAASIASKRLSRTKRARKAPDRSRLRVRSGNWYTAETAAFSRSCHPRGRTRKGEPALSRRRSVRRRRKMPTTA
jgi:hypothetical protein